MPCSRRALLASLLLLVFWLPARPAHAEDLVTFAAGTSRTIPAGWNGTFRFPIDIAGTKPKVVVRGFALGTEQLPDEVTATIEGTQTLLVTVPTTAVPRQGAYTVTVQFSRKAVLQTVALTLTRTAATLSEVGTVKITEEGLFQTELTGLAERKLKIRIGDNTELTTLHVETVTPASGQVQLALCPPTGDCEALDEPVERDDVKAGGSLVFDVALTGDFPYTTTTQQVRVHSPQLVQPVALTFEVRRERPLWILGAVILGGIIIGWLTRAVLPTAIRWLNTALAKKHLQDRLAQLLKTPDVTLQAEVGRIQNRLGAVNHRKLDAPDVIKSLEQEAIAALDDHEKRLVGLRSLLVQVNKNLTAPKWTLPSSVDQKLTAVGTTAREMGEALAVGDPTTAGDLQPELEQRVQDLIGASEQWLREAATHGKTFGEKIPEQVQDVLDVAPLIVQLGALAGFDPQGGPDPQPESPGPLLSQAQTQLRVVQTANSVAARAAVLLIHAAEALTKIPAPVPGADRLAAEVKEAVNQNQADPLTALQAADDLFLELIPRTMGTGGSRGIAPVETPTANQPVAAEWDVQRPDRQTLAETRWLVVGAGLTTSLLAILIALVAGAGLFALNLETWTGATSQILAVAVAAIALDITTTAVVNGSPAKPRNPGESRTDLVRQS